MEGKQQSGKRMTAGEIAFCFCFVLVLYVLVPLALSINVDNRRPREPELSVVVNGSSGLDSRAPRTFNLTLSIDNLGGVSDVCVGGDAVVSYRGVPLASGPVQDRCVPSNGTGQVAIIAANGGVGLPPELAGLMDAEKRAAGVVQLEVRVISLKYRFLRCTASLDDDGAAPPSPCQRLILQDQSDGVERVTKKR